MTVKKIVISSRHFTLAPFCDVKFPSIKAACAASKESGKIPYIYREWMVVADGIVKDPEREVVHAYGDSVCTVKGADEELRARIIQKYNPDEIVFRKKSTRI